jgi:hypothetical protein
VASSGREQRGSSLACSTRESIDEAWLTSVSRSSSPTGTWSLTVAPAHVDELTSSLPPTASRRSAMPWSPLSRFAELASNPSPSSYTSHASSSVVSACRPSSIVRSFSSSLPTSEAARRCLTASGTSCCCAQCVDVALELLARSSWAAPIHRREARTSLMRRTFRKHVPACAARSSTGRARSG